ncbi:hypothetical protein AB1Y20_004423 [Prymnesium parvum]|uniref:DUF1415 domain-containing protein n=1 Tax=Prymnesium parvum TaxID=97485 RepID=A0AB34IWA7_PRYPA
MLPPMLSGLRPQRLHATPARCPASSAVALCRTWVEHVVIGLALCPWAQPVHEANGIRFAHTAAATRHGVYSALLDEIDALASAPPPRGAETTVLVTPNAFPTDFRQFNEMVGDFESFLQSEAPLGDQFQVVGFHPHHCFGGEDEEDPGNFVSRSPCPMVHILRQQSVTSALDAGWDTGNVPRSNKLLLHQLHAAYEGREGSEGAGAPPSRGRVDARALLEWKARGGGATRTTTFAEFLSFLGGFGGREGQR